MMISLRYLGLIWKISWMLILCNLIRGTIIITCLIITLEELREVIHIKILLEEGITIIKVNNESF